MLASKVSFYLRIQKLWLSHGDHLVAGNTHNITSIDCFVSQQCCIDVQMLCNFVVLLIIHFQDKYSHLPVSLHLTEVVIIVRSSKKYEGWWVGVG